MSENRNRGLVGLKIIRKQRNLNQLKVAMDLNISREVISYYENGKRNPDIEMLKTLSRYFNVSIDFLINGREFNEKQIYKNDHPEFCRCRTQGGLCQCTYHFI